MSEIFAKVFGFYFLAIAVLALFFPDRMRKLFSRASKDECFIFYGAVLSLLLGGFIVSVHNIWVWNWPLLITLIGWWGLIKGYLLLIYPESIKFFSFVQNRSNSFYYILGVVWFFLAGILLYNGWF